MIEGAGRVGSHVALSDGQGETRSSSFSRAVKSWESNGAKKPKEDLHHNTVGYGIFMQACECMGFGGVNQTHAHRIRLPDTQLSSLGMFTVPDGSTARSERVYRRGEAISS